MFSDFLFFLQREFKNNPLFVKSFAQIPIDAEEISENNCQIGTSNLVEISNETNKILKSNEFAQNLIDPMHSIAPTTPSHFKLPQILESLNKSINDRDMYNIQSSCLALCSELEAITPFDDLLNELKNAFEALYRALEIAIELSHKRNVSPYVASFEEHRELGQWAVGVRCVLLSIRACQSCLQSWCEASLWRDFGYIPTHIAKDIKNIISPQDTLLLAMTNFCSRNWNSNCDSA